MQELTVVTAPEMAMQNFEMTAQIANRLKDFIETQKLYQIIQGKKFVLVEGWEALGGMLGILAKEESTTFNDYGDFNEYESNVQLVRLSDGIIVGRGSAICASDESTWANRPRYARRSMAITRATGKAYRIAFSWIVKCAGYEPTPAEDMPADLKREQTPVAPPAAVESKNAPAASWTQPKRITAIREKLTYFKNAIHLKNALKKSDADFDFPAPNDNDAWRKVYAMAKAYSEDNAKPAPRPQSDDFESHSSEREMRKIIG